MQVRINSSGIAAKPSGLTAKQEYIKNAHGEVVTVLSIPVYPCTWFLVERISGERMKIRAVMLEPLTSIPTSVSRALPATRSKKPKRRKSIRRSPSPSTTEDENEFEDFEDDLPNSPPMSSKEGGAFPCTTNRSTQPQLRTCSIDPHRESQQHSTPLGSLRVRPDRVQVVSKDAVLSNHLA